MRQFQKLLAFLVYSNLFIVACAVLMVNQTYRLILKQPPNKDFIFFVCFSTLCSYSFHWWLSRQSAIPGIRNEWLKRNRRLHVILFFIGFAGAIFFFLQLWPFWFWLSVSAIATFLYSAPKIAHPLFRALRKVALGKTIFLAFVWTYVTTTLPVILSREAWTFDIFLFNAARFFLIYAICVLFDCRDRQDDRANGIRSLITFLDQRSIYYLFLLSLLVYFISTVGLLAFGYTAVQVVLLLIPGIVLVFLFDYSQRNFSDVFYYLVLDGLMALSAAFMLIPGI